MEVLKIILIIIMECNIIIILKKMKKDFEIENQKMLEKQNQMQKEYENKKANDEDLDYLREYYDKKQKEIQKKG